MTFALTASLESLILAGSAWGAAALSAKVRSPPLPLLFGMGVLLYLLSVGLHYAALAAEASREAERREAEARTLAREAELQSLRFQTQSALPVQQPALHQRAGDGGWRAGARHVHPAGRFPAQQPGLGSAGDIPLRDELALARSYLEVEQVRFGARLRVEAEIAETCAECAVPALLLQPLVENAVKARDRRPAGGRSIRLSARRSGGNVHDHAWRTVRSRKRPRRSIGMGLQHVRRRLRSTISAAQAAFDAQAEDGRLPRVELRFPCESSHRLQQPRVAGRG